MRRSGSGDFQSDILAITAVHPLCVTAVRTLAQKAGSRTWGEWQISCKAVNCVEWSMPANCSISATLEWVNQQSEDDARIGEEYLPQPDAGLASFFRREQTSYLTSR